MITKTKYVCSKCFTEFDNELQCIACEESHKDVASLAGSLYSRGREYPDSICIRTDDDHIVKYTYLKDLGAVLSEGGT